MANDPAFLFYPGDYLRDTQCLSEDEQVAYDRIMCEHMRNICITQERLKFFTKKLSPESVQQLKSVLTQTEEGFYIRWVRESILKRRSYSEGRRNNRLGKSNNHMSDTSLTYDSHMENEIENEDVIKDTIEERKKKFEEKVKAEFSGKYDAEMLDDFARYWTEHNPGARIMRFEMAKNQPFDISRRLVTWKKNNDTGFGKNPTKKPIKYT